jgi:RNA ligase (TIGR02306 family)
MRKLAQVAKILSIAPIEGADNIELVQVLGWRCIAKKGEFKPDDLCIYFELDSLLPTDNPAFAFMEKKGWRVKTMRLGKFNVVSQGLALPLTSFPNLSIDLQEGDDVAEILGIKKWEPEESGLHIGGKPRGNFPSFVPKTDQTRIQAMPNLLDAMRHSRCVVTLKCDGSSATFAHFNGDYHVCSRNLSMLNDADNKWWQLSTKYDLEQKLRSKGNFALQGEVVGPGIQKNRMKLGEHQLFAFDVYDIDRARYLDYADFIEFCSDLNIPTVPILNDNLIINHSVDDLLAMAKGEYDGGHPREGLVIKEFISHNPAWSPTSFKVINNDYLLKIGE